MTLNEPGSRKFLETISRINFQKWHSKVRIVISKDFEFEAIALINSGADLNCIQEGIIPRGVNSSYRVGFVSCQSKGIRLNDSTLTRPI